MTSWDRRALVTALSALLAPCRVQAATVRDSAGAVGPGPGARAERVVPARPPAAMCLYTLAPCPLSGWPRATGRANPADRAVVLALKPELILDVGSLNPT